MQMGAVPRGLKSDATGFESQHRERPPSLMFSVSPHGSVFTLIRDSRESREGNSLSSLLRVRTRAISLPLYFSLSRSRPSHVTAAAISGDSWEDYCGAARRERRSRLLSLLNARVAGESFNYFAPL